MATIHTIEEWLVIGLFAIAVSFPLTRTRYKTDLTPSFEENRQLAQFPPLSLKPGALIRFPRNFGRYFDDHFALRTMLIRWQAFARVKWLGDSSSPNVFLGKNGWLFDGANIGLRPSGKPPLTQEQIARWRQSLIARNDWLAGRGIKYVFVIAPDKREVYPEYLPENGRVVQDQLIAALRDFRVEILDLRPSLREAKQVHPVYLKTDNHWNSFGSFVAYETIINDLSSSFPELHPLAQSDIQFSPPSRDSGNLARMLGLHNIITEEVVAVTASDSPSVFDGDYANPNELTESEQNGAKLPRMILLPARLKDGKPHEIRIRFAGTNVDLSGTPLQIQCAPE